MHRPDHEGEAALPLHAPHLPEDGRVPAEDAGSRSGSLRSARRFVRPDMSIIDPTERQRAHAETRFVDYYAKALQASEQFRKEYDGRLNVVKSSQMPFE